MSLAHAFKALESEIASLRKKVTELEHERDDLSGTCDHLRDNISDIKIDCRAAEERLPPWAIDLLELWHARSSALDRDDLISLIRAKSPEAAELLEALEEHN